MNEKNRIIGLHFFNPVPKMQLVEIVKSNDEQIGIIRKGIAFVRQLDKLPVTVKSTTGFLINRILMPYLMESINMLEEGIHAEDIDQAATDFGMPMGPIELADTVGLDVGLHVAELLSSIFGYKIPESFKKMVESGALGKKTGKGFYVWKNGKKVTPKSKATVSDQTTIQNRLMLRFINEAIACNREKIVENKNHLDAGIIFGTGFAPFLGGPIHYVESKGAIKILESLNTLQQQYGDRFSPDAGWSEFS